MKRTALFLALALVISLLCGCVVTPPPATTAPPRPSVPVETTTPVKTTAPPETTEPAAVEPFAEYEALLDFSAEPNWLARSLGCLYEKPEDIDLYYMFYLGVNHPGSWEDISPESRQSLIDQGFMDEFDLQLMPAEKLEEALQTTFGIGLDDVTIPESWGYIESEDAYCTNHSDAYFPGVPVITAVEDDGVNIRIYYNIEGYFNLETEEFLDRAELVLCLERLENGTIHAVSNIIAH